MRILKRRLGRGASALPVAVIALALALAPGAPVAAAKTVGAVERFPTKCGVGQLVSGPDGNVWFSCFRESPEFSGRTKASIARITPQGDVAEFALPTGIGAGDLTAGPDGNLWFTFTNGGGAYGPTTHSPASAIGRITTTGQVTLFRTGLRPNSNPTEIVPGTEGNLWFLDAGSAPEVGRVTPQGAIVEFPTGVKEPLGLGGIVGGPEGSAWFTQVFDLPHGDGEPGGVAGRVDAAGVVTTFGETPAAFGAPVAGPGGDVWFIDTSERRATIDRVTPGGELAKFSQGLAGLPTDLVAGPDGNLWYTAQRSIGRVTPSGEITSFDDCLTYRMAFSEASTIVAGPGEELWFTSVTSRELPSMEEPATIGRVTPDGAITLFKGGLGLEPQALVAGPDGRVWFTDGRDEIDRITPSDAPVNTFIVLYGKASPRGVATIPVEVPGPGTVKLRRAVLLMPHKRTVALPGAAAVRASPAACGATSLRLKLRGKALARLRRDGSLRLRVTATFTPTGGSPDTRTEVTYVRAPRGRR
jgi:streptogramin lyase